MDLISSGIAAEQKHEAYLIFVIFLTRATLEDKIYTEKRQFFALNL